MRFPQDLIDKVREANNIVEIIGQHTELKGSGHRLMGRCPFPDHSDKSPSFSVTEDNQLYYCYGCKKGGNIFTFLETFNGLSFPEAVEYLARRASIPLPEKESLQKGNQRTGQSREQKDILLRINKAAAVFFHQQLKGLPLDHVARKYMEKRGLNSEIVEKFRLGVTLEDWQGLVHHFEARKIPLNAAESLGLIKPKKGARPGDTHFDLFRDRLMFPIFSPSSDVIGFGGRTLGDQMPKYLNSSDSPVFNKSRVLYGIHETGKYIRAQDSAIVVEGYMDAIALYAAGIKNVVAILGTAFTPEHAKILKRYTANVTMLLDGDEAGINAADRSLPVLLQAGLMPKGFILPDKMDPDDYVKAQGAQKLQDDINRAPELFSLLLSRRWLQGYNGSPSDKVKVIEEAAVSLRGMVSKQLQELYILELSRQLDVEISWVRKALAPPTQGGPKSTLPAKITDASGSGVSKPESTDADLDADSDTDGPIEEKFILKGAPKYESFVLSLLLSSPALMAELVEAGTDDVAETLTHEGVKRVLLEAVAMFKAEPEKHSELAANLVSRVDLPSVLLMAQGVLTEDSPAGFDRKLMTDYLHAIRQKFLKTRTKALATELRDKASPEKLQEFMSLQKDRLNRDREPSGTE